MTNPAEAAKRLRALTASADLVTLGVRPKRLEPVEGRVMAVGIKWVIIAPLTRDLRFTGFVATRIRDVRNLSTGPRGDWRTRWLDRVDERPGELGPIDPKVASSLLSSAGERFGVVEVQPDRNRSQPSMIGLVEDLDHQQVRLRSVDASTAQPGPVVTIAFKSISRVAFGGPRTEAIRWALGRRATTGEAWPGPWRRAG